ncbi:MAG: hypothetical protein RL748_1930 [Pseudomonadota bacterium]|jgi:hypothetical protein
MATIVGATLISHALKRRFFNGECTNALGAKQFAKIRKDNVLIKQEKHQGTIHETMVRYQRFRRLAHQFTEEKFKSHSIQLRDINYSDAVAADEWRREWADPQKTPNWEWTRLYNEYHTNAGAKRFDVALLTNGALYALCYGVPTSTKLTLKIHGIARNPTANPLEGHTLEIILFCATVYARILKCKEIWLCQPMNEALVRTYQKHGYTPCKDHTGVVTHLTLQVNYE